MKKIIVLSIIFLSIVGLSIFGYFKFFANKLSENEINEIIDGYDYSYILGGSSLNINQISEETIIKLIYSKDIYNNYNLDGTFDCTIDECANLGCTPSEENWDCDNSVQIKCALSYAGYSNTEMNQLNIDNFKYICDGSAVGDIITITNLNKIIEKKFGLTDYIEHSYLDSFNAFEFNTGCGDINLYSDPNTDKILFTTDGGCMSYDDEVFLVYLNGYKKNNQYIINLVKGMFSLDYENDENDYLVLVAESNPNNKIVSKINLDDEKYQGDFEEALIKEHKDQLDNYKLIFEKVDDTYQFVSVEYIN